MKKERKVYWTVERAVWGAQSKVRLFFREEKHALEEGLKDYRDLPIKRTTSPELYEKITFED